MLIIFYQFGSDHHHVTIHPLDSPPISSGYSKKHLDIDLKENISGQSLGKVPFYPMDELQNIDQVRLRIEL